MHDPHGRCPKCGVPLTPDATAREYIEIYGLSQPQKKEKREIDVNALAARASNETKIYNERKEKVSNMTMTQLADEAKNGSDSHSSWLAVQCITDQCMLQDVILNSKHYDTRVKAIENITDRQTLKELLKKIKTDKELSKRSIMYYNKRQSLKKVLLIEMRGRLKELK